MLLEVCAECEVEFRPETNGVIVAQMFMGNTKIYKLWNGDLMKCPICGKKIVAGIGNNAFAEHFQANLEEVVEKYKKVGIPVIYAREYPVVTLKEEK